MTCRDCKQDFVQYPGKPGYVNQCENCADDVDLLGGNMIYSHKTAPEIEVKLLGDAKRFTILQRRFGAGVTRSLTQPKETNRENPGCKSLSGAEAGAQYFSKLGEKRSVKR